MELSCVGASKSDFSCVGSTEASVVRQSGEKKRERVRWVVAGEEGLEWERWGAVAAGAYAVGAVRGARHRGEALGREGREGRAGKENLRRFFVRRRRFYSCFSHKTGSLG